MTALYMASLNGHVEVVNILLQSGARVDIKKEVSLTFLRSAVQALRLVSTCLIRPGPNNPLVHL